MLIFLSDDMPLEDESTIPRKISDPINIEPCDLSCSKFRPSTVDHSVTIMKLLEKNEIKAVAQSYYLDSFMGQWRSTSVC